MNDHAGSVFPSGIITAAVTPMNAQLDVHPELLVSHCHRLLASGSDGLVLLGTTGEANSFSVEERKRILDLVLEGGVAPNVLMLGTGCCAISDTITLTNHALASGVHNVLMLPPFYYKPVTDKALFEYYAHVIESIGDPRLNIYLYHIPKNTGIDLSIVLLEQLLDRFPENIVGIKDSGGAWDHMVELIDKLPILRLYSGTEEYLLDTLTAGGAGCISATANVTVLAAAELIRTFRNGTHALAQQQQLTTLRNIFSGYPFVGAIKGFLASDSGDQTWNYMRPPNQMLENGVINLLLQKFRQNSLPTFQ